MCINILKFRKRKGDRARFREYETKSCAYNQNKENSYIGFHQLGCGEPVKSLIFTNGLNKNGILLL